PRFPECVVLRQPVRVRTRPRCFWFGCVFGKGASFPPPALQSPPIVRARFVAVPLQFFLFLPRSLRFEVRLPFVPAPVSLERRSHCAARENLPPGQCLRAPD